MLKLTEHSGVNSNTKQEMTAPVGVNPDHVTFARPAILLNVKDRQGTKLVTAQGEIVVSEKFEDLLPLLGKLVEMPPVPGPEHKTEPLPPDPGPPAKVGDFGALHNGGHGDTDTEGKPL